MIETTNNIIYWIGYVSIIGIFLVFGLSAWWVFFEKLMNSKTFFLFIFNNALDKRLKKIDKETFDKWQKEQKEKFERYNKIV